jgi:hypothetical protein
MKLRSLLVILGVFAIGFCLGILTSAQVRNKKMKEFRTYATPEDFRYRFEKMLQPTPEQMEKIVPILDTYGKKNHELRHEYQKKFFELMKQYRQDLEPNLTKEQIEKLSRRPWIHNEQRGQPPMPDSLHRNYRFRQGPPDTLNRENFHREPGIDSHRDSFPPEPHHRYYPMPGGDWF